MKHTILGTFNAIFLLCACWSYADSNTRPNFIIILADDLGYADTGFTGSQDIRTPNLDELAASGVIFRQGYVTHSYCAPTRAALLTGRYQARFGFEANPAYDPGNPLLGIDSDEVLFPDRLRSAGYVTGIIGKWHLGTNPEFHPYHKGFDYFFGFPGGGHDYFKTDMLHPIGEGYLQTLIRNSEPTTFDGYLTSVLSGEAVKFIESNKLRPFFLYLSYNAPHNPLQAPEEDLARYKHIASIKRRTYAAMVDIMDRGIGDILRTLDSNNLRENTLICFLSDNGGPLPKAGESDRWNGASNAPFRGGKGNLYEGGIRVPFVASWPRRIPRGLVFPTPVIALDISRTIVEQAGADAQGSHPMEGVDLIPYITGEKIGAPHKHLYWRDGDGMKWAIISSDGFKLVKNQFNSEPQLFYLPEDISEADDIIEKYPQLAQILNKSWQSWNAGNVPNKILNYMEYNKRRDHFFIKALPGRAVMSDDPAK